MVENYKKKLNAEQLKAIRHKNGPLLIIAGAGTGKTTVITERIKYLLVQKLAKPEEILALTFTEKASKEMEERIDIALPYGYTKLWISTFHSFCDHLLKLESLHIGLNPGYKLMTEAQSLYFVRQKLFKFDLDYFRPLGNPEKFISGLLQHFSRLKDEDIESKEYLNWVKSKKSSLNQNSDESKQEEIKKYQELAAAYQKYEELKTKEGLMDFSDLVSNALKLFRTRKGILKQYQNHFKYILVDEFQDTNIAQNELVKLLSGEKQNLTVVCDDDQAIYKWRGASVSNVIQFRNSFPQAKLIVLNKNYRSTQEILNRSYDFIQNNNPDRLEIKEKINKKLISERRIKGEKIEYVHLDRVENEADWVAQKIKEQNKYRYKDFAVLVRANSHAEPFLKALSRLGIPCQFLGPGMLFRQPEVKDLIAYLKVLSNFEDNVCLYRVLSMKYWDISARYIAYLLNFARKLNISLFEVCEKVVGEKTVIQKSLPLNNSSIVDNNNSISADFKSKEKVQKIIGLINRHLKLISKETAGQILYYFLEESGILAEIADYKSVEEEREALNISRFFNKLKTFEIGNIDAGVFSVVNFLDLALEIGESPLALDIDWTENNAVNILTVHSAKGLEFPVVFLVNLVSQRFPTTEKREQIPLPSELIKEILPVGDSHLEEERRLFYVGLTRARDFVYLTASNYYGEGKREKKVSSFVKETIGEESELNRINNKVNSQLSFLNWKKIENISLPPDKIPVKSLSYSQIDTYNKCPLLYKYRYIVNIPVPAGAAASFGASLHAALYHLYSELKTGKVIAKEELSALLEKVWMPVGYKSKDHEEKMKKKGQEALVKFYETAFSSKTRPLALEENFSLPLSPDLKIRGKIDRVDEVDKNKIEIIDYKTGKVPTQKEIDQNLQIAIYALAAESKWIYGKNPEDIILSFYFLETQEKMTTKRTQKDLEKVKADILEKARLISESRFLPTPGFHCDYCSYRMICEAWK